MQETLIPVTPHTRPTLPDGTPVQVVHCRQQGYLRNQLGIVRDCTRSLAKPHNRVYFVWFPDLHVSAWLAEDQLERVEVEA